MSLFPFPIRPGRLMLYLLLGLTAATTCLSCRRQYTPKPDAYFRIDPYPETYRRTILPGTRLSFEIPEGTTEALGPRLDPPPRRRTVAQHTVPPLSGHPLLQLPPFAGQPRPAHRREPRTGLPPEYPPRCGAGRPLRKRQFEDLCHPLRLSAESATPLQFIVTDSTRYLLRGALYFDEPGKSDSIAPVVDDLSDHIAHLIESIEIPAR